MLSDDFTPAAIDRQLESDAAEYMGTARTLRLDGKTLSLFDMAKLDGPPPPEREWILKGYIPAGEITLFTGHGGAGKSLASQQLATCVASGTPFLGIDVSQRGVLYVTAEDDEIELHRRQRAIGQRVAGKPIGLRLASLRGRDGNELAKFGGDGEIERTDTYSLLHDTIVRTGVQLVILDNIAHLFAGNENDRGQVTRFVNVLYSLVRDHGVTIVLIGHPNKSGDAYSGSTAWLNAVRSQIDIDRVREPDGSVPDPDERVLKVGKANYARAGQELRFRWHEGALVHEDELPADTRAELEEAQRVAGENAIFMNCLQARMATAGREVGPSPGPNYAPARFAKMTEAKGLSKAQLERAMERLFHAGTIETAQVKRKGSDTKTVIVEAVRTPSELPSEPVPNTRSEPFRTSFRTVPNTLPIPKGINGAGPFTGPPPLDPSELDWSDGEETDD